MEPEFTSALCPDQSPVPPPIFGDGVEPAPAPEPEPKSEPGEREDDANDHCHVCGLKGPGCSPPAPADPDSPAQRLCRGCFSSIDAATPACVRCGVLDISPEGHRAVTALMETGVVCAQGRARLEASHRNTPGWKAAKAGFWKALAIFAGLLIFGFCYVLLPEAVQEADEGEFLSDSIFWGAIAIMAVVNRRELSPMFALSRRPRLWLIPYVFLCPVFTWGLAELQTTVLPNLRIYRYSDNYLEAGHGWAMVILCVAVLPAFFEEIAFRGLIQRFLTLSLQAGPAILVTSLMFAAIHVNLIGLVFYLVPVGLLTGWVTWRTGSLLPAMTMHFLHNAANMWQEARNL